MTAEVPEVICGVGYCRCVCELAPHETGPCRCECGGMWEIIGDRVRVRAMPQRMARGHPGEGEPNPALVSDFPEWIGREDLDIDGGPWPLPGPGMPWRSQ